MTAGQNETGAGDAVGRCDSGGDVSAVIFKAHKLLAEEYIAARPQICTYTSVVDGSECSYVFAGMLPDFEKAPEDEAAALKAVDDYYAREAQAS